LDVPEKYIVACFNFYRVKDEKEVYFKSEFLDDDYFINLSHLNIRSIIKYSKKSEHKLAL